MNSGGAQATMSSLDMMQVWVEAFLATPALNSELRHRLLWDVVYKRMEN